MEQRLKYFETLAVGPISSGYVCFQVAMVFPMTRLWMVGGAHVVKPALLLRLASLTVSHLNG